MKKIYVVCPYGLVTGGPDALHQMVYYLRKIGLDASIVYSDIRTHNYSIPEPYRIYLDDYLLLKDIQDNEQCVLIVPETENHILNSYNKIKKYVWWLSVDNDLNSSGFINKTKKILKKIRFKNLKKMYKISTLKHFIQHRKFDFTKNDDINHICASFYAYDYVSKRCLDKNKVHLCIEPISKVFLEKSVFSTENKKNIILYNPKKNFNFTKKIIDAEKKYEFVPLTGFNQDELINIYSSAKLYIDFGNFPGAERIPKEAVINGCCIITGKFGASAFYNDVPLEDEYKFEGKDENIDDIVCKIEQIMTEYDDRILHFEKYRQTVWNLEKNFIKQLKDIFKKNNNK